MSHLNKLVRRVLIEAETKSTEPEEPSYWDEVGKTVDRYGRAIGDEVGRWSDAASELGAGAASAAGTLAKATLDTFVGQAHAPSRAGDVESARASRATLLDVVIPSIGSIISHLALTKFRISAKIADSAGLPVRDIISGKYGKEAMEDIFAGSVLHDVILGASFVPGAAVAGMLLDSVVYAAEGDRKGAIATLAMAGVFHAGGKVAARRADDAARGVVARKGGVEILAPKRYTDLNAAAKRGRFTHAVPPEDRVTAIVKFVDDAGARMEAAGLKGGRQIAAAASQEVRSGTISIAPALEGARAAEAQEAISELMTPGLSGETPLAVASRKWKEVQVTVEKPRVVGNRSGRDWGQTGTRIDRATGKRALGAVDSSQYGASEKTHLARAKGVMSTPAFISDAKRLYGKLGMDVTIKPVVGTHQEMFERYLTGHSELTPSGMLGSRIVVVPMDEGVEILAKMNVGTSGVGPSKITIVPVVNTAGVDSLPTPWMIAHAMFDSAEGNLLVNSGKMPRTKAIVDAVKKVYDELGFAAKETLPTSAAMRSLDSSVSGQLTRWTSPQQLLGMSVNSGWGANTRAIINDILPMHAAKSRIAHEIGPSAKQYSEEHFDKVANYREKTSHLRDTNFISAPPVGARVAGISDLTKETLLGTKQGVRRVGDYIERGDTDHIAEIMTAAITKNEGYLPNFEHMPYTMDTHMGKVNTPNRLAVMRAAEEIQRILGPDGRTAKEAFAADLAGEVLFVFPD